MPAIAASLLIAGCGGTSAGSDEPADADIAVVATTTHLADMARQVAGGRAQVTTLLPANADPHDYEVRPGDIEALSGADVVLRSGGDLDEWLTEAIDGSGTEAPVLNAIERVRTIEGGEHHHEHEGGAAALQDEGAEEGHAADEGEDHEVDPHWWQDPRNGSRAVTAIRDAMIDADPDGRAELTANATAYVERLDELDAAIASCMRRVPENQRKLVTTHDSLGYYADRYDIEVIGTVIPSLSTQGQPSAGEIDALAETIEHEGVRAIFTEQAVSPKVEEAIAEEAGAEIGTPLWADSLGPEGSDASTYADALAANTRSLVSGFTDGAVSCELPS